MAIHPQKAERSGLITVVEVPSGEEEEDNTAMGRDVVMKLAIVGAGITGAYLFRLLKNEGIEAHIFDRQYGGRCGLKPCAWGTSSYFVKLVEKSGLNAGKYILRHLDYVLMDNIRISTDIMTFDKPRFVRDLLRDVDIRYGPVPEGNYDRVIDATGVSRALLPAIDDDVIMGCRQYLIETRESLKNRIKLGNIGYAWCFPLSDNLYHVGCGSLLEDPQRILKKLGWLESRAPCYEKKILCQCCGTIRLTGPHQSQPFVANGFKEGIWGVGEAIGCVAPLAGDGVVPGMHSVLLMLDSWDNPGLYRQAVLDEFSWMQDERRILNKMRKAEGVGIQDAFVLKRNSQRMGMRIGVGEAITLLKNLR